MTTTDAARALQALRKSKKGGRPRTTAPRCPCGAMTAARAATRGHKCVQAAVATPDQGGHMQDDFWRELHRLDAEDDSPGKEDNNGNTQQSAQPQPSRIARMGSRLRHAP